MENIKIKECKNVYWASTDEYTVLVNGNEHVVRIVEDNDSSKMLYLSQSQWINVDDVTFNLSEVSSIAEMWENGDLAL